MTYRGVTPTYTFVSPAGLDLTQANKIWVTFSTPDEREIFTKTGEDVTVTVAQTKSRVQVSLTQAETLKIPAKFAKVQLNWTYAGGSRGASNKFEITFEDNLKNEVLE